MASTDHKPLPNVPKPHQPDLGGAVTSLAENVEKVMVLLYDHQKSLDGASNLSFTDVRKGLKDHWEALRSYLQRCYSFGADALTLKNAARTSNEGDLIAFLYEMEARANELRKLSQTLESRHMFKRFTEENELDELGNAVNPSPAKGKRSHWNFTNKPKPRSKSDLDTEINPTMLKIESNTDIIFRFWDDMSKSCRSLLEEFKTGTCRMTSVEVEQITCNWQGYQEAIIKAIASIAKTCDAILVEAEGAPTRSPGILAPVAVRRLFARGPRNGVVAAPPHTTSATPHPSTTASSSKTLIREVPTTNTQNLDDDDDIVVVNMAANAAASSVAESSVESSRAEQTDCTPPTTTGSTTPSPPTNSAALSPSATTMTTSSSENPAQDVASRSAQNPDDDDSIAAVNMPADEAASSVAASPVESSRARPPRPLPPPPPPPTATSITPLHTTSTNLPPSTTASSSKIPIQVLPTTNAQNLDDDDNIAAINMPANEAASSVAVSPVESSQARPPRPLPPRPPPTATSVTPPPPTTSATPPPSTTTMTTSSSENLSQEVPTTGFPIRDNFFGSAYKMVTSVLPWVD